MAITVFVESEEERQEVLDLIAEKEVDELLIISTAPERPRLELVRCSRE